MIHGRYRGRWLAGNDHTEEIADVPLRQGRVTDHDRSLQEHAFLYLDRDRVQFRPPFLSLGLVAHARRYVPGTIPISIPVDLASDGRSGVILRCLPETNVATLELWHDQPETNGTRDPRQEVLGAGHGLIHGPRETARAACFPHQPEFHGVDLGAKRNGSCKVKMAKRAREHHALGIDGRSRDQSEPCFRFFGRPSMGSLDGLSVNLFLVFPSILLIVIPLSRIVRYPEPNNAIRNYLPAALHALVTRVVAFVVKFVLLKEIVGAGAVGFVQCVLAFHQEQGALQRRA